MTEVIDKKALLNRLPISLKNEFENLKKNHDEKLREALKDDDMAKLFLVDPGQVFRKLGIPLSQEFKSRLEKYEANPNDLEIKSYILPNGQKVNVNIKINYR